MSLKGSGEALAQLIAEKANPKTDVWFGGTGDPHLQAAEQGLTLEYKSPALPQLHGWAQQQAEQSQATARSASTPGRSASATTPSCSRRRSSPVPKSWADLLKPEYKGEIQVANPASQRHRLHDDRHAGAADGRGQGLRLPEGPAQERQPVHALGHRRRSRRWRAARPRCRSASCTTARARRCRASRSRPSRRPKAPAPRSARCRIIKGARNLEAAKKFYEWALTPQAQQFGAAAKQFQLPSNKATPIDPRVPDFKKIKFIDYDYAKYGASRPSARRLIARWEKEVNSLPR